MGSRPIRHGKGRIFGSDQRSSNKEKHRPAHHEDGKSVHNWIVSGCHGPCLSGGLYIYLATVESRPDGSSTAIPTARSTRSLSAAINNGESPTAGIMRNLSIPSFAASSRAS